MWQKARSRKSLSMFIDETLEAIVAPAVMFFIV